MRCSNIGPHGARNWFRVLDSPRQLLSPHHPDVLRPFRRRSPADSAVGSSAPPGSHAASPAQLPMLSLFLPQCYFADPGGIAWPIIWPMLTLPFGNLAPSGQSAKMIPSVLATVSATSLALSGGRSSTLTFPVAISAS